MEEEENGEQIDHLENGVANTPLTDNDVNGNTVAEKSENNSNE